MGLTFSEVENRIGWMIMYFCVWELIIFVLTKKFAMATPRSLGFLLIFGLFLVFLSEYSKDKYEHTHIISHAHYYKNVEK